MKILYCSLLILSFFSCLFSQDSAKEGYEVISDGLEIPWDAVFLPDGSMLVTERPGRVVHFGKQKTVIPIETTYHSGEGGLMGLALHPDFKSNRWLYLYNTTEKSGDTRNRVERYRYKDGELREKKVVIDDIPGASYHDGGRIAFGPDGFLYITTGDAGRAMLSQHLHSLAGKILRVKDDGSPAPGNPFDSEVFSYGHRNPQGLAWDDAGRLWSTEHGPSGLVGGRDELNLIKKGKNYGWPHITGSETRTDMVVPVLQSGLFETWAPASALYWDGSVFFGGLRGEALYEAKVSADPVKLVEHFKGVFGRIRTVIKGPDGYFYFMTSNRDGRGMPREGDDKIIKVDPKVFR